MTRSALWIASIVGLLFAGRGYAAPIRGRITSRFQRPDRPDHNGTDVAAPTGTPVLAPFDGTVAAAYWTDRGGHQVLLSMVDGRTFGVAHLSRRLVVSGQDVMRGQELGLVGSTGNSTGPHAHITLREKDGNYIDPEKWLRLT